MRGVIHISDKTKEKMRLRKLGKPSTNKTTITELGIFESISMACLYHGIQKSTYYRRVKRNATNWVII